MRSLLPLLGLFALSLCSDQGLNSDKGSSGSKRHSDASFAPSPRPVKRLRTQQESHAGLEDFPLETLANLVRFLDLKTATALLYTSKVLSEAGHSAEFAWNILQTLKQSLKSRYLEGEPQTLAKFSAKALTSIEQNTPEGVTISPDIVDVPSYAVVLAVHPNQSLLPRTKQDLLNLPLAEARAFEHVFIDSLDPTQKESYVNYEKTFGVQFSFRGPWYNYKGLLPETVSRVYVPLISYGSPLTTLKALQHLSRFDSYSLSLAPLNEALRKHSILRRKILEATLKFTIGYRLIKHGLFDVKHSPESHYDPECLFNTIYQFFVFTTEFLKLEDKLGSNEMLNQESMRKLIMDDLSLETEMKYIYDVLSQISLADIFLSVNLLLKTVCQEWSPSLAPVRSKLEEFSDEQTLSKNFHESSAQITDFYFDVVFGQVGYISPLQIWQYEILENVDVYSWCTPDTITRIWDFVSDPRTEVDVINRTIQNTYRGDKFYLDLLQHILSTFDNAKARALCYQFKSCNAFCAFLLVLKFCLQSQASIKSDSFTFILQMIELHGLVDEEYVEGKNEPVCSLVKILLETLIQHLK